MNATTTKRDLCLRIAKVTGLPYVHVKASVQAFLDLVTADLADGRRIELRDFGIFSVSLLPERRARNPRTGEKIMAGARKKVKFKPGRLLQELDDLIETSSSTQ